MTTIRFFSVCTKAQAIIGVEVISMTEGLEVHLNTPEVGSLILPSTTTQISLSLTPTIIAQHKTTVRFKVSGGYYDFSITLESVDGSHLPMCREATSDLS